MSIIITINSVYECTIFIIFDFLVHFDIFYSTEAPTKRKQPVAFLNT